MKSKGKRAATKRGKVSDITVKKAGKVKGGDSIGYVQAIQATNASQTTTVASGSNATTVKVAEEKRKAL